MANCFHTALEMPPCRNNSEDTTTDAGSEKSNAEAKDKVVNMIYAISCVLAVLLDPLFLYIPILNDDMKCIGVDKNMKIVAVALRSFTDLIYIVKIIFQIYKFKKTKEIWESKCGAMKESSGSQAPPENAEEKSKEIWESKCGAMKESSGSQAPPENAEEKCPLFLLVVRILAVLPIPQVVIIIFFTKMWGSRSSIIITNSLVVLQYVPRVFSIYLACKELKIPSSLEKWEPWLKGRLSFFMYILASNVFGALWYFFSIQRMIYCWQSACHTLSDHNDCKPSAFECHSQPTIRSRTLAYDLCPINPQNTTLFDFGIFIYVLQPGMAGSTNYPQKLTNCLLWAMRNLSSFGSNLQPSINTWENIFATSISIIGLLLFLYLIGKLQIYMGTETTIKAEERYKNEIQLKRKIKLKLKFEPKIYSWLHKNNLDPKCFKSEVEKELVDLAVKSKKDDIDENEILRSLSDGLRDQITIDSWLGKNDLDHHRFKSKILKAVEGKRKENEKFDLNPNNILSIVPNDIRNEIMERIYMPTARLKQVPILRDMNEQELKKISEKFVPRTYTKSTSIIKEKERLSEKKERKNEPLKMIFIIDGVASIKKRYCVENWKLKAGEFYGEELLLWLSSTSDELPEPTESVKAETDVKALVLEGQVLQSLVSECMLHRAFKEITFSPKYKTDNFSMLKKVQKLEKIDEKVLKEISAVLVEESYEKGTPIFRQKDKLDKMFLVTQGTVGVQRSGKKRRELYKVGGLYGEELLYWALDMRAKRNHPVSVGTVTTDSRVDVLILSEKVLEDKVLPAIESPPSTDSELDDKIINN